MTVTSSLPNQPATTHRPAVFLTVRQLMLSAACGAICTALFSVPAYAQNTDPSANGGSGVQSDGKAAVGEQTQPTKSYRFDIPALPLMQMLERISELTGNPFSAVAGVNLAQEGRGLSGTFDLQTALQTILEDTDLTFSLINGQIIILQRSQQNGENGTTTAPVVIQASRTPVVVLGTGAQSGSTSYDERLINSLVQGSNDPNMVFRANPNVQYVVKGQRGEEGASATTEQDLRPQTISISGGKVDQNNIMLDGVGINSVGGTASNYNDDNMPEDDDSSINADTLHGLHPQTVYVDASILKQAEIIDSNVSAKYGGFQGGVVNYEVKDPSDTATFSANISRSGSNWTDYHVKSAESPDTDARPPKFTKLKYGTSASGPIDDHWGVLVSAGRSTAEATKTAGDNYYGRSVTTQTKADNVLGKVKFTGDDGIMLTAQLAYAPYAQEWAATENYNSNMDITGDGLTSFARLETPLHDLSGFGFSGMSFDTKISYSGSENMRDSESSVRRRIRTTVAGSKYADLCDSNYCYDGWFGDLAQQQHDLGANADLTGDFLGGNMLLGGEVHYVRATRTRDEDAYYYSSVDFGTDIVCADADDVACDDRDQANNFRTHYTAFSGRASFVTGALYADYTMVFDGVPFGEVEVNPGLRLERETFLGNTNLAPRFNATYYTDWDVSFTGGWNRYYAANMLGYALRDATPATIYERRNGVTSGADTIYSSNSWYENSTGTRYRFRGAGLRTPFVDEHMAAIGFPLPFLGGSTRLKWIERKGKDQFSRDTSDSSSSEYNLSNEGTSSYSSYSVEWSKELGPDLWGGQHAFNINSQFSERLVSNDTYYATSDEETGVYYKGSVVSTEDLAILTGNLDEPIFINASLYSSYFDDRLRTGLTGRYTFGYDTIKDSGSNINVSGETYDIYEEGYNKARFDLDMTLEYDLLHEENSVLTLTASIDNVLNRGGAHTLSSSTPYSKGRTFWLGLNYTY
ncbi:MAG: hypothetical protein KTR23_19550 [Rhodospirillales bacterium]|nr:hypothetical protein [Rhodospirillales bacterium]